MNAVLKFPFYAKAALLLVGFYVLIDILIIGQDIILPILYASIIAVLISPLVNFLIRKKINRSLSILSVLSIALVVLVGLIVLVSSQASRLIDAFPQLVDKFQHLLEQSVAWTADYFNISVKNINGWLATAKVELLSKTNMAIGLTVTTMGGVLATAFLTPVYIFMIQYYQPHLVSFIHKLFGASNDNKVSEILSETKSIIQSYLVGLFAEFVIVAILNSIGFFVLGMDYAIVLGIIGALLNVIPYLGGIIAVVLFMIIALVTKSPVYMIYVLALHLFIQLVDNNYIVPKIVGSKVKLNPLFSLIAVILGGALWGIPGMFLSIPITAILKLIFDRIHSLKPWGFLLGEGTN